MHTRRTKETIIVTSDYFKEKLHLNPSLNLLDIAFLSTDLKDRVKITMGKDEVLRDKLLETDGRPNGGVLQK